MHDSLPVMRTTQPAEPTVLAAGRYRDEWGADKQLHSHPTWEVVYYLKGDLGCRIGDSIRRVGPGEALVIPPGTVHGETARQPWACYYLLLEGAEPTRWPCFVKDDAERTLGHLCQVLVGEWRSTHWHREQMLALLLGQLDIVMRRSGDGAHPSAAEMHVREFERVLEERFVEHPTISSLAREVGVSYSYLRAQFVRLRGQTPTQRLQHLRAQQALAMIRNSDQSLELIAHLCGYASASHLSRHIVRVTGKRPGRVRAEGRL